MPWKETVLGQFHIASTLKACTYSQLPWSVLQISWRTLPLLHRVYSYSPILAGVSQVDPSPSFLQDFIQKQAGPHSGA